MTQEDADHLYAWVQTLDKEQLRLLWRWVMLEWLGRWFGKSARRWDRAARRQ